MFYFLCAQNHWTFSFFGGPAPYYFSHKSSHTPEKDQSFLAGAMGFDVGYRFQINKSIFINPVLYVSGSFPQFLKDQQAEEILKGQGIQVIKTRNGVLEGFPENQMIHTVSNSIQMFHTNVIVKVGTPLTERISLYGMIGGGFSQRKSHFNVNKVELEGSSASASFFNGTLGIGGSMAFGPKVNLFAEIRSLHGIGKGKMRGRIPDEEEHEEDQTIVFHAPRINLGVEIH
jgi:opacity protein-like surface antigen